MSILLPMGAVSSGKRFSLSVTGLNDTAFAPAVAIASITIGRDGDVTTAGNGSDTPAAGDWINPRDSDVGDDYEVRCTVNSGDSPTAGGSGTWVAINTDRTFSWTTSGDQTLNVDVTIEIRRTATATVVASTTITGIVTRTTV